MLLENECEGQIADRDPQVVPVERSTSAGIYHDARRHLVCSAQTYLFLWLVVAPTMLMAAHLSTPEPLIQPPNVVVLTP